MILQLNVIKCKYEDLTESPKILDYGVAAKMRNYKDKNGDYYYLKDSGWQIYYDKILKHVKEGDETIGLSATGVGDASSTSLDIKTLIDDMLQTLVADNHVK